MTVQIFLWKMAVRTLIPVTLDIVYLWGESIMVQPNAFNKMKIRNYK